MKIILPLLILLVVVVQVHAQTPLLQKQIILKTNSNTCGGLLAELNKELGGAISYSTTFISVNKIVQFSGNEKTVEDYLLRILKNQPVSFFEKEGKIFIIRTNTPSAEDSKVTFYGYVTDRKSGERLIGTSVYMLNKKAGTTTNAYGFYSITTTKGEDAEIEVTHIGYDKTIKQIKLNSDEEMNIALEPVVTQQVTEVVVVNTEAKENTQNKAIAGRTEVPTKLLKSMPSLLGEADVLKAIQLLPGVQSGNESTAGLYVRGGSPDQNLILLDGVPVYNANHFLGLFSTFNADVVKHVEVMKSGFPASYGGRVSSVIDVRLKDGDKYSFHGEGGIGLLVTKLALEGPVKKGKSSFLISARRSYIDLPLRLYTTIKKIPGKTGISFFDLNLKYQTQLTSKDRLYFSFYKGGDQFKYTAEGEKIFSDGVKNIYKSNYKWGNNTAITRWDHQFSKKLFSNFSLSYSTYRFFSFSSTDLKIETGEIIESNSEEYQSGLADAAARFDFDFRPSTKHYMKYGGSINVKKYFPGTYAFTKKDSISDIASFLSNQNITSTETDFYFEDDMKVNSKLSVNVGLRYAGALAGSAYFPSLQPRVSLVYKFSSHAFLKASYAKTNQFIHLLTNPLVGLPIDLWVPVTEKAPPQNANQYSLGYSYAKKEKMNFSAEVYYKKMNNLLEYTDDLGFVVPGGNWDDRVETGTGDSYGAEFLFLKKLKKITGMMNYTLSWSNRYFKNVNAGIPFYDAYDRRHHAKLNLSWEPTKKIELSMNWAISTGRWATLPVASYIDSYTGEVIEVYEGRNNYQTRTYHRMDIAAKFIKQKKKYQRIWLISIINVYNRFNPFYIDYENRNQNQIKYYRENSIFPILPSVSYQFKF